MSEDLKDTHAFDPSIQSENIAFKRDEMIVCRGCNRANPPNRFNCIYCAHELEISPNNAAAKFTSRKLETWERGFNAIFVKHTGTEQDIRRAADLLGIETDRLGEIIANKTPLPVARVESKKETAVICDNLEQMGFVCSVISDDDLVNDRPHVRLSRMEFTDEKCVLVNFNTDETIEFPWSDLALIVGGILTKGRVDLLEKKRRRGKTKLIDETSTSSDEQVFDLYRRHDATGFRVFQAGFDFSCLREDKGLLASDNMRLLIGELVKRAPNVKYINSYSRVRRLLDDVWEIESRKDHQGLQRSGFGKVEFGRVALTSNLTQFNKFSRLQFHLR